MKDKATQRPRAVFFDLFRTLASVELSGAPGRMTHEVLGVPRQAWSEQLLHHADTLTLGAATDTLQAFRTMVHAIDPRVPEATVREAMAMRRMRFGHAVVHIEPPVLDALDRLRGLGVRLGLISNAWHDEITTWDRSPLAARIETAVFSCQVALAKPHPRIYALAAARMGVRPSESWFVGDGESDELAGARRAGMTPVLITRHLAELKPEAIETRAPLADFTVRTVAELAERIQALPAPPRA